MNISTKALTNKIASEILSVLPIIASNVINIYEHVRFTYVNQEGEN